MLDLFARRKKIAVWTAFESLPEVSEFATFAKLIFTIVVNQAGCKRTFSDLKVKQTQCQHRLGLEKLDKMTKVDSHNYYCQYVSGLITVYM
jgi:hypothetical protein